MSKLRVASMVAVGMLATGSIRAERVPIDFSGKLQSQGRSFPTIGFIGGTPAREPSFDHPFRLLGPMPRGTAGPVASASAQVTTASTSIVADGERAFVADTDSGSVVRTDLDGTVTGRAAVGGVAQLAIDRARHRIFATDRSADRIAVIDTETLSVLDSWPAAREPYGIALSPDGRLALVTGIADHELTAIDTHTGKTVWTAELVGEPRGVAISPDGRSATVSFLTVSAVATVDLGLERPTVRYVTIGRPHNLTTAHVIEATTTGAFPMPTFARGAFAAVYRRDGVAVIAYQQSTPVQSTSRRLESTGTYGGGSPSNPPIVHRLAFVSPQGRASRAHIDVRVPRAIAYDARRDYLFVAGKGNDRVVLIAEASQPTAHQAGALDLRAASGKLRRRAPKKQKKRTSAHGILPREVALASRCGPSGLAVAGDGQLLVHCGLSQSVTRVELDEEGALIATVGGAFGDSRLSSKVKKGREIFYRSGDRSLTAVGALACANCHPDGRADGLSWRIQGHTLQTPVLRGRLVGTHPFKWNGQDATLAISLTQTITRLGGTGIATDQIAALRAYLESLPRPRSPRVTDPAAAARGRALFASAEIGCSSCHDGPELTDGQTYDLADDLGKVDTPSLIGIAHSAPYFHDGSAATLEAVLMENGSVHGMGRLAQLDDGKRADLVAYLETL